MRSLLSVLSVVPRRHRWPLFLAALLGTASIAPAQPFTVQGPGVNASDFRITTFASGLNFPLAMARLSDGSLIIAVHDGTSYFNAPGKLLRLTDTNQDGIADAPGTVLYSGLPSTLTAVRVAGTLILVTGQSHPFFIFRAGATPAAPLMLLGQISIAYPPDRGHPHSALNVRKTPGATNCYDVVFQLGAAGNFSASGDILVMTNNNVPGADGLLVADALHMFTLIDHGTSVSATNLIQLAAGLRNAAGFAFHPVTGDLYLQDNGIDGLVNGNEPHSADELNFMARTNIGGAIENFGFPTNYTSYRTNAFVGGAGIPPLIAFQPIPDPFTGRESEGPNDLVIAPPGFPHGLNTGVFVGFHGRFNATGSGNEENPLVYANPATGEYFHFIRGQQPGIGHLDGLLATRDSLFVADLASNASLFSSSGAGVIYQIKSLVTPALPTLTLQRVGAQWQLSWERGALEAAEEITGPWKEVAEAFSPLLLNPNATQKFYRTMY